jgi:4-amino-4-deoxy-L-arabinose transferase-like glycosyltransferase
MDLKSISDIKQRMPNRRIYILLYIILFIAYLGGLFLQIMEVDAAQYAAMSMEMLHSHIYLKLFDGGVPYLDKPPLLMWLSSLSFYLFGISEFTYRLPSFLASIFAAYCTYKLARQWYNAAIANWSALILASCQAFFLFNQDVKTDNLLTSMAIFAIWQLSSYTRTQKIKHLITGAVGIGLAMLAKGPIGLVLPAAAIGSDLLLKRKWKLIFDIRWVIAVPVILLVLSPFLVGLYQQWGMHGIRFFFWTQSFGRITGESEWNNGSDPFFFIHTFLWAFIPWTISSLFGLFLSARELIRSRFRLNPEQEGFTIVGFILIFIALSLSHYKLPHYIFILFPLAAIFTARWIFELWDAKSSLYLWISKIQLVIYMLLSIAGLFLLWYVFRPWHPQIFAGVALLATFGIALGLRQKNAFVRVIAAGVICIAAVNIGLNWEFYPRLIDYQSSNKVGKMVHKMSDRDHFYFYYLSGSHSLNFYSGQINRGLDASSIKPKLSQNDIWVFADQEGIKELTDFKRFDEQKDQVFQDYTVQKLGIRFLDPNQRYNVVRKTFLVHLAKQ